MYNRNDIFSYIHNPYGYMKEKQQKNFRELNNINMLLSQLVSMFEYEKSEEYQHIDDRTIELCMILNGLCGWIKDKGQIRVGYAYNGGRLDDNGIGNRISISFNNGESKEVVKGKDNYVLGLNNCLMSPDLALYSYADILTEIELSEKNNIIFSRNNPVYVAKNNKIKQVLTTLLDNLKLGKPAIISDDNIKLNASEKIIEVANITDMNAIDKMQYLTTYYTSIIRRWGNMVVGQTITDGQKLAQQSVSEVESASELAKISPMTKLKYREKMCKELEQTFGGSIKVKFSPAFNHNEESEVMHNENKEFSNNTDN